MKTGASVMPNQNSSRDHVDELQAQWHTHMPSVDTEPMAVLERISRIARLAHDPIEAALKSQGVDRAGFDVLAEIRRSGPPFALSPTQLYTSLMLSSSGLTSRLARLEKAKLVYRAHSKTDGRSQLVGLTRKGRSVVEAAFRREMEVAADLIGGLTLRDRNALAGLMRKLALTLPAAD